MPEKVFTKKEWLEMALRIGVFLLAAGVILYFSLTRISSEDAIVELIERAGYGGLFLVSVVSGFNIFVPIPVITFLPILEEAGFTVWAVVAVASLGMTFGDMLGYGIGFIGRKITRTHLPDIEKRTFVSRLLNTFEEKHPLWPYLVLAVYAAFAPLPNELLVIPMAFAGYKIYYIFPTVFIGNFLFNTAFVLGITSVLNFL